MSGASKQRTRQERIESLGIPKPRLIQWWERSDKLDVSIRVGIAIVAALAMLLLCQTWRPPFPYRAGSIPGAIWWPASRLRISMRQRRTQTACPETS